MDNTRMLLLTGLCPVTPPNFILQIYIFAQNYTLIRLRQIHWFSKVKRLAKKWQYLVKSRWGAGQSPAYGYHLSKYVLCI